jgi:hypothetical protein
MLRKLSKHSKHVKGLLGSYPNYSENFGVRAQKRLSTLGPYIKMLNIFQEVLKNIRVSSGLWLTPRKIQRCP